MSENIPHGGSWYADVETTKERELQYPAGRLPKICPECRESWSHGNGCSFKTYENYMADIKLLQDQIRRASEFGSKYYTQLQRTLGKLAQLKHENNKLRKANERLRKQMKGNHDPKIS